MTLIKLNSRAIPDSTVVNTDIADGSISTAKLAADAVTTAKFADGSVSSAKIADDAVTGSKLGIETGRRNVFINGNFDVAQRGTSATYTGGIWQYLSPDRWMGHFDQAPTGATHHVFDGGPNSGSNKFAEVRGPTSANSGNGGGYFGQKVESASLSGIRAKNSFTISGYIKRSGSVNQAISTNIICPTATDNFAGYTTHGSVFNSATISGNGTAANNGTLTLTSVDTWYYFTITKTSATSLTNFDKGLQIYWAFGNCHNTADKIQFAQLQLEEGTEATTFEHHSFGEELALCQRYYQQSTSIANAVTSPMWFYSYNPSEAWGGNRFPVEMRANPTCVLYNNAGTAGGVHQIGSPDITGVTVNSSSKQGIFLAYKANGFTTDKSHIAGWTADSEL